MLENFNDFEKNLFLRKFIFFAVRKEKRTFEESIAESRKEAKGKGEKRTFEEPEIPALIQRRFPQMGVRYLPPAIPQLQIARTVPMESSILEPKLTADVSESIPQKQQKIEERRMTVSEEELAVPVPKKFEGKRQVTIQLGKRQPQASIQAEIKKTTFDKLSVFLNDPSISSIESLPGENISIVRGKEKINIPLILSEEEIKDVINEFSDRTRIPLSEFFKAFLGEWQINAIISDVISPRFILTRTSAREEFATSEKAGEKPVFRPLPVTKIEETEVPKPSS